MLTKNQRWLYWREVKAAQAVAMRGRETFTKYEENEWRHGVHVRALGADKSSTDFTNRDLDKVLAELRAISQPANLAAQLEQMHQPIFRARHGVRELARSMGKGDRYVQGVIDRMNAEGKLGTSDFEELGEAELLKVKIALTQDQRRDEPGWGKLLEKRKEKRRRIYELHA